MFTGAVPRPVVEQITRIVPFEDWRKIWVGCSGSFRFDRAVKDKFPACDVFSNDVSLVSCAIGAVATGETFPIKFTGRLERIEALLEDRGTFEDRVAATFVALDMGKYKADNDHARAHFQHYLANFEHFWFKARARLGEIAEHLFLSGFYAGDFRKQIERAQSEGGGVVAFPPTYKGGYERLYKFLDENVEWPSPTYDMWDPNDLDQLVKGLENEGLRYCFVTDHELEDLEAVSVYRSETNKPVYAYANRAGTSVRRAAHRHTKFSYRRVTEDDLVKGAEVRLEQVESHYINFLRDVYLARGIAYTTGEVNLLVFINDALAGGLIYSRSKFGSLDECYLLSDFAIAPVHGLARLIATIATSAPIVRYCERKFLIRIKKVNTTAFTDKPASMKYRGAWKLSSRKPGMLNYAAEPRELTPGEIYARWRTQHARNQARRAKAERSQAA